MLVLLFNAVFLKLMPQETALLLSVILARVVSAAVNFTVNRRVVFKGDESLGKSIAKYAALAVGILAANYLLMRLFNITLGWPLTITKIVVELLLFLVSLTIQGKFVYRKGR